MRFRSLGLALGLVASALFVCPTVSQAKPLKGGAFARKGQAPASKNFYLKDGDRVVFYGDSITDQRLYTTYIESYCVSRFPGKHFTFVHSGWGGDRVTGGGGGPIDVRLRRDVLAYKPTVVTICLGMNDGSYRAFNQGIFDTYAQGYRHIIETLMKELPGVRITLLTAPAYDDVTRAVGFPGGYNATLVAYGEFVKDLARRYGLTLADTNAPLVAALGRANTANPTLASKILPDRVHPGPGGHLVMAAAVLKAWNAPEDVAEVSINASSNEVAVQKNTTISDLKASPTSVSLTHRDNALPWPIDRDPNQHPDMSLILDVTGLEHRLNDFTLRVTGLSAEKYNIKVDGNEIGNISRGELEAGIDLAAIPTLPSNMQAVEVLALIRKHNDLHFQRWRQVQVPHAKNGEEVTPETKKQMDALDAEETKALQELRAAVKPKAHKLELTAVQ